MAHELAILQAARLKGRLSPEMAATSAGADMAAATTELNSLRDAGYLKGDSSVRLTPKGRTHLVQLVGAEMDDVDQASLSTLYAEFDDYNTQLKQIVTDWQMKDDSPNDHTDGSYDHGVIDRLAQLHAGFEPLASRIAVVAPRLRPYVTRFRNALDRLQAGDTTYMARPIIDSYHTVWFEFHEEMIGLLGLSREEEAAAGRAV